MITKRTKTDFIVIHAADTYKRMDIGAKEIDRWHRDRGFFNGIGYHFVIRRNGLVEKGRPQDSLGAHVEGYNSRSLGVCMVGGRSDKDTPEDNFTKEQYKSLLDLVIQLKHTYPKAIVLGHRELNKHKACPCFDAVAWWKENRKDML
jgi:N-acetylmuramoyl-L-alanine amidase